MPAPAIGAAATGRAGGSSASTAEKASLPGPTDAAQESAQRAWWYLLFAGVMLLAAETVIANRIKV